jgi:heme/copper-type cytochrome/quinol oxidase subunit 2
MLDIVISPAFWIVAGSMVLIEAAIIVTALRMPVRSVAGRSIVGGRPAEVVWTLLPALLLAALAVLSFNAA